MRVADWWREVEWKLVQVQRSVPVLSVRGQMCVYLNQTMPLIAFERWQRISQPYPCLWIIRGDEEPALAVDEVCEHLHKTYKHHQTCLTCLHLDHVVRLQVLGGEPAQHQVEAAANLLAHNVVLGELPLRLVGEPLAVVVDVGLDNVEPGEHDVRSVGQELGHPGHVPAAGVQEA